MWEKCKLRVKDSFRDLVSTLQTTCSVANTFAQMGIFGDPNAEEPKAVDCTLASIFHQRISNTLHDKHVIDCTCPRNLERLWNACEVVAMWSAHVNVFTYGICGPDLSEPFSYQFYRRLEPFLFVSTRQYLFCAELYQIYLDRLRGLVAHALVEELQSCEFYKPPRECREAEEKARSHTYVQFFPVDKQQGCRCYYYFPASTTSQKSQIMYLVGRIHGRLTHDGYMAQEPDVAAIVSTFYTKCIPLTKRTADGSTVVMKVAGINYLHHEREVANELNDVGHTIQSGRDNVIEKRIYLTSLKRPLVVYAQLVDQETSRDLVWDVFTKSMHPNADPRVYVRGTTKQFCKWKCSTFKPTPARTTHQSPPPAPPPSRFGAVVSAPEEKAVVDLEEGEEENMVASVPATVDFDESDVDQMAMDYCGDMSSNEYYSLLYTARERKIRVEFQPDMDTYYYKQFVLRNHCYERFGCPIEDVDNFAGMPLVLGKILSYCCVASTAAHRARLAAERYAVRLQRMVLGHEEDLSTTAVATYKPYILFFFDKLVEMWNVMALHYALHLPMSLHHITTFITRNFRFPSATAGALVASFFPPTHSRSTSRFLTQAEQQEAFDLWFETQFEHDLLVFLKDGVPDLLDDPMPPMDEETGEPAFPITARKPEVGFFSCRSNKKRKEPSPPSSSSPAPPPPSKPPAPAPIRVASSLPFAFGRSNPIPPSPVSSSGCASTPALSPVATPTRVIREDSQMSYSQCFQEDSEPEAPVRNKRRKKKKKAKNRFIDDEAEDEDGDADADEEEGEGAGEGDDPIVVDDEEVEEDPEDHVPRNPYADDENSNSSSTELRGRFSRM